VQVVFFFHHNPDGKSAVKLNENYKVNIPSLVQYSQGRRSFAFQQRGMGDEASFKPKFDVDSTTDWFAPYIKRCKGLL
jgi:hypothetical protein